MSRLTEFYRGAGTDTEGRTLAEMWGYSDEELEDIHNFIQWMFPLREPSRFNPDASLLTDADIAEFRSDPRLGENLLRSFGVFLAFVGLRLEEGRVVKAADFGRKEGVWLHPNHNWLRSGRVLASTRMLGLEGPSGAFFEFLGSYRDGGQSGITSDTFRYWKDAAHAENPADRSPRSSPGGQHSHSLSRPSECDINGCEFDDPDRPSWCDRIIKEVKIVDAKISLKSPHE